VSADVLRRFAAGEVSAEIALAQLLLTGEVPDPATLPPPLAALARDHADQLPGLAALAREGLEPDGPDPVAATARHFDRLAAIAPEAAVAFYALGDPALLDRATAELVAVLAEWAPYAGRDVLDFGCGIGRVATALAAEAASVVGVDLSAGMVAEARRRAGARAGLRFAVGGGDALPLADASADLVLVADALPFLVRAGAGVVQAAAAEWRRVLRPGGDLVVFNWSYRGDPAADVADAAALAARHGFALLRAGERPFAIWDGTGFHLRRQR